MEESQDHGARAPSPPALLPQTPAAGGEEEEEHQQDHGVQQRRGHLVHRRRPERVDGRGRSLLPTTTKVKSVKSASGSTEGKKKVEKEKKLYQRSSFFPLLLLFEYSCLCFWLSIRSPQIIFRRPPGVDFKEIKTRKRVNMKNREKFSFSLRPLCKTKSKSVFNKQKTHRRERDRLVSTVLEYCAGNLLLLELVDRRSESWLVSLGARKKKNHEPQGRVEICFSSFL